MVAAAMMSAGTVPVAGVNTAMARRRTTRVVSRRSGGVSVSVSAQGVSSPLLSLGQKKSATLGRGGVSMRCRGVGARDEEGVLKESIVAAVDAEVVDEEAEEQEEVAAKMTTMKNTFNDWVGKAGLITLGGAGVFGSGFDIQGPASTAVGL
jgi:hypothetical protein